MDALVSGTEAKATISKESARPWDGSCAVSAWPLLGVFYLTSWDGSHALLRGWRGSMNVHMWRHTHTHTHTHFPLSCHQLAMEQEVRSAGWDRSVQEGTAPRPPACCCLTQPGRKTWKSRTFGLIKSSCPCPSSLQAVERGVGKGRDACTAHVTPHIPPARLDTGSLTTRGTGKWGL